MEKSYRFTIDNRRITEVGVELVRQVLSELSSLPSVEVDYENLEFAYDPDKEEMIKRVFDKHNLTLS